jgi:hypothetical protein
LNVLAPLGLRLYGNALWKTESRGTALESCFCGRLESFTDYPNLIRSVRININLRSLQGFDAPTHRDFLVPRLGGFLLSSAVRVHPVDWKQIDLHRIFRLDEFPGRLKNILHSIYMKQRNIIWNMIPNAANGSTQLPGKSPNITRMQGGWNNLGNYSMQRRRDSRKKGD